MNEELVFNTRKLSVALVEAELAKHPDLTIDQVKALLEQEGSQVRPRKGVERLLDARLMALAEGALEAAAEDMMEPEEGEEEEQEKLTLSVNLTESELADAEAIIDEAAEQATEDETGDEISLGDALGNFSAEELAKFGLCRMMGPDPDDPMAPEGVVDKMIDEAVEELTDEIDKFFVTPGTPVHVTLENGQEHEGYYVKPQTGAMVRLRDGKDTIVYAPDDRFFVSPREGD